MVRNYVRKGDLFRVTKYSYNDVHWIVVATEDDEKLLYGFDAEPLVFIDGDYEEYDLFLEPNRNNDTFVWITEDDLTDQELAALVRARLSGNVSQKEMV